MDVHSLSQTLQQIMASEYNNLTQRCVECKGSLPTVTKEIQTQYGNDASVKQVLDKIINGKDAVDPCLSNISPAGLLCLIWTEYIRKYPTTELYQHFKDTLIDMGGTCIQGDTHRLFTSLVALDRSISCLPKPLC